MDDVKRQATQRFLYHFLGVGQEFQKYVNKEQGFFCFFVKSKIKDKCHLFMLSASW